MESNIAALLFLLILFPSSPTNPPPPSSSISSSSPRSSSFSDLSTCLLSSGVHNFTLIQNSHLFPHLLNFSIQNLRFSHPQPATASIIILPHDLPSLQSSIICCRASSLTIRLRSGGHSYEGLSYLAPNHSYSIALLDLMNLDHIDVDVADKSAWLQSGATLGQLYHAISAPAAAAASPQPLAFSAGSCPTVGSGGHIAGGGFGLLSRKYGLAADNVLDAILIAPDGRILDREAMGKELFWAIRGGGGGTWGAVYAWKIQLQTVPNRVSAFIVNRSGSNREVAELIDVWQKVAPALPDEFYVSCFVGGSLPESTRTGISVTFKGLYLGPVREARTIMAARFRELDLLDQEVREMSWIESVVYFSGLRNGSSVEDLLDRKLHTKTFFKAKSDYVQAHIEAEDLIKMVNMLSMEPKAYLIMDPYGGSMARRRIDDIPFPHRSKNLYAIQHLIEWTQADDRGREGYIHWIREWYEFMGPMVSREPRAAYVNYLDLDLGHMGWGSDCMGCEDPVEKAREWGEKYFLGNYDRLVRVKTIVDPDNVFWNEQSIPPLTLSQRLVGHGMAYDFRV